MEDILLNVMYDIPSLTNVAECVITKEVIEEGIEPTLVSGPVEELKNPEDEQASDEGVSA